MLWYARIELAIETHSDDLFSQMCAFSLGSTGGPQAERGQNRYMTVSSVS